MTLSSRLIIRLFRWLNRTLGVAFLRSYALFRRTLNFCLRLVGPRMLRCQAKLQNEETTSPTVPSLEQIQATGPTPGSAMDIVLPTPVLHRDATHAAPTTIGFSIGINLPTLPFPVSAVIITSISSVSYRWLTRTLALVAAGWYLLRVNFVNIRSHLYQHARLLVVLGAFQGHAFKADW
ncbi:hypothetical protein BDN67DRAFT_383931 [Paxillus ammoniavirescens]|nr:hypothetical protein BDN67DRAFT_383931 [Paxillus ammoniavirescens]